LREVTSLTSTNSPRCKKLKTKSTASLSWYRLERNQPSIASTEFTKIHQLVSLLRKKLNICKYSMRL
jgi:hypothetical protein